jgi:hypothetical protein
MDLLGDYSSDTESEPTHNCDNTAGDGAMSNPCKTAKRGRVELIESSETKEVSDIFIREVPHTRGNWSGHVFVKIPSFGRSARCAVQAFCSCLEEAGWSGTVLSHASNLHLSLSRPFFLQQSSIEALVRSLEQRLTHERSTQLVVTGEKLLVNDSRTRSFWCWSLSSNSSIRRIICHVDTVLREYQQPTYYESPEFHVSLASLPGNVEEILRRHQHLGDIDASHGTTQEATNDNGSDDKDDDEDSTSDGPLVVTIEHVHVTFGTMKSFRIDLMT